MIHTQSIISLVSYVDKVILSLKDMKAMKAMKGEYTILKWIVKRRVRRVKRSGF